MKKKGTLYLLPNVLGDHYPHQVFLPASVDQAVEKLDGLIAESAEGGRRFLGRFLGIEKARHIPIALLRKKASDEDLDFLLEPMLKGEKWGFVSDAGTPCIADPGAALVRLARRKKVDVKAFVGPSSILFSLMLSGLPAQQFTFHGYLPNNKGLDKVLQTIEDRSKKEQTTQIFIEAPHRNQTLLEFLVKNLEETTWLSVARDLTLPTQKVVCQKVKEWRGSPLPDLRKKPTTFLVYSGSLI